MFQNFPNFLFGKSHKKSFESKSKEGGTSLLTRALNVRVTQRILKTLQEQPTKM